MLCGFCGFYSIENSSVDVANVDLKINRVLTNIGHFQSVQSPGGEEVAIEKTRK